MAIQGITVYYDGEWSKERDQSVLELVRKNLSRWFGPMDLEALVIDGHPGEPASAALAKPELINFFHIKCDRVNASPVLRRDIDGLEFDGAQVFIDDLPEV